MKARISVAFLLLTLISGWAGCTTRGRDVRPGAPDAASGETDGGIVADDANITRPDAGRRPDNCTERARWIYLVDSDGALLRFEPDSGTITSIGNVSCTPEAHPFAMAVDRNATAFVLHTDHRIYQVSTVDAACSPTTFAPDQMGFELFGMGFVSQSEGSNVENLFVAGGAAENVGMGRATLGRIDVPTWTIAGVGPVTGSPELTGTGTGELWGFFPDGDRMTVRQLDKATGGTLREFDVSSIDRFRLGPPQAWAFAFWGGRFYIFYQGSFDTSTNIYRVTPETGAVEPVRMDTGYRIVGAGVSTCAPTILI